MINWQRLHENTHENKMLKENLILTHTVRQMLGQKKTERNEKTNLPGEPVWLNEPSNKWEWM